MVYGYHRTSTKEQHLDRGIAEIKKYCAEHNIKLEKVYTFIWNIFHNIFNPAVKYLT